jgi:hypothetical protein
MLSDIISFLSKKPGVFKRALIANNKVVAWSLLPQDVVVTYWKEISEKPLRLVPKLPLEGCKTQETWNKIWDKSKVITNKIRITRLK